MRKEGLTIFGRFPGPKGAAENKMADNVVRAPNGFLYLKENKEGNLEPNPDARSSYNGNVQDYEKALHEAVQFYTSGKGPVWFHPDFNDSKTIILRRGEEVRSDTKPEKKQKSLDSLNGNSI